MVPGCIDSKTVKCKVFISHSREINSFHHLDRAVFTSLGPKLMYVSKLLWEMSTLLYRYVVKAVSINGTCFFHFAILCRRQWNRHLDASCIIISYTSRISFLHLTGPNHLQNLAYWNILRRNFGVVVRTSGSVNQEEITTTSNPYVSTWCSG